MWVKVRAKALGYIHEGRLRGLGHAGNNTFMNPKVRSFMEC